MPLNLVMICSAPIKTHVRKRKRCKAVSAHTCYPHTSNKKLNCASFRSHVPIRCKWAHAREDYVGPWILTDNFPKAIWQLEEWPHLALKVKGHRVNTQKRECSGWGGKISDQEWLTKGEFPKVKVPLLSDTTCHLRRARGQILWVAPHLPADSHNRCSSNVPAQYASSD